MRFPKESVAAIHDAAPNSITVRWPAGSEPQKGRVYWLQCEEDERERQEKAEKRREYSPETHAEVMALMHRDHYGKWPDDYKSPKRRRRSLRRRPDSMIRVLNVSILYQGWEATVEIFQDPDPRHPLRIKGKVPAGSNPIFGHYEKTETEPDQIIVPQTRREREDEEESLRVESAASADCKEVARLERRVAHQKAAGKPSHRTEQALARARKRAAKVSAGSAV